MSSLEERITRCSAAGCRAQIVFLKTKAGKSIPVDVATVEDNDEIFEPKRHRSHFATCPAAKRYRRPR